MQKEKGPGSPGPFFLPKNEGASLLQNPPPKVVCRGLTKLCPPMDKIRGVGPGLKPDCNTVMKTMLACRITQYLTIMALAAAAGCATKPLVKKNYLFFPPAPDEPRIQY